MGRAAYPAEAAADHGRRGWFQQQSQSAVEGGVAEVRGRERAVHLGVSLSAGDEQVEQDRAPDVLPHRGELERAAVGESRGGGEFDRAHDDDRRIDIRSELDENSYPTGQTVSDEEMDRHLTRDKFHGEWNYKLTPRHR